MNVSEISLGGANFGDIYGDFDQSRVNDIVQYAINNGINFIDTSYWYGQGKSEERLGKALRDIPRSSYYLATKVGRYEKALDKMSDFTAEKTLRAVDESLQRLGLPYVDLIQIHDLEFATDENIVVNQMLPALQKVCDSGKARYIGITAYPLSSLVPILEKSPVKIHTVVCFSHATLHDDSLKDYLEIFEEQKVGIINVSSLSMGLLTPRGPPPWHPAPENVKEACKKAVDDCEANGFSITKLARNFSIKFPGVSTTVMGIDSVEHLDECLNLELTHDEQEFLENMRTKYFKDLTPNNWENEQFQMITRVHEAVRNACNVKN